MARQEGTVDQGPTATVGMADMASMAGVAGVASGASGQAGLTGGSAALDALLGAAGESGESGGSGAGDGVAWGDVLAAWQREQDRLSNRAWRRPGGLARPAGL